MQTEYRVPPVQFRQFIGKEMRLSQVEYAPRPESQNILGRYMGKNTPERREYILAQLIMPVAD